MLDLLNMLAPSVGNALVAVLAAAVPAAVAWLRLRTQRLIVEQATLEAEAVGRNHGMSGAQKKGLATSLVKARTGPLTRPSDPRISSLIEGAVDSIAPGRTDSTPPSG